MSALCTLQILPCNIFQTDSSIQIPWGSILLLPAAQHTYLIQKVLSVPRIAPGNVGASLASEAHFCYLQVPEMPSVTKQNPFVGFQDQN